MKKLCNFFADCVFIFISKAIRPAVSANVLLDMQESIAFIISIMNLQLISIHFHFGPGNATGCIS